MQPLDFFEEPTEQHTYKTLKTFLILTAIVLYMLIPIIIVLTEKPFSFDAFVLILIGVIPFTLINLFCSSILFTFSRFSLWMLSKIVGIFRITPLAKLFKTLRQQLDFMAISVLLNLLFLAYYLQGYPILHFLF